MLCSLSILRAQNQTITGKVVTDEDNEPLPGVNIHVIGTNQGVTTDIYGSFSINVKTGQELQFSFVGYKSQTVQIGNQTYLLIELKEDENLLQEVVVLDALGLEKKRTADLSSSTRINTRDFIRSGESGTIQGMSGKTSGVTIIRANGDPGAGAYIQIRGQNTILGEASPLIVLDGVPISNNSVGNLSNLSPGSGVDGVSQQSRLNDINPNDIEYITVLKGVAAANIWGTGAANGVIVIKTKSGKYSSKPKVSVNVLNQFGQDFVVREFEKQSTFGQGRPNYWYSGDEAQAYDFRFFANVGESWGPKIATRTGVDVVREGNQRFVGAQTGKTYYPITNKQDNKVYNDSNRDQVFRNGQTWNKNIDISFAGSNSNTLISIGDWNQKGIFQGQSDYRRTSIRLNSVSQLRKNITAKFNFSYTTINSNRIQQGSNLNGLYLGYLRTSPDFDNTDYIGTNFDINNVPTVEVQRSYRNYLGTAAPAYNNPGWTIYQQKNPNDVNRVIFTPEFNWTIFKSVSLTSRVGYDRYTDNRESFFPFRSAGSYALGGQLKGSITELNINFNTFISGDHQISSKIHSDWILGFMIQNRDYNAIGLSTNNFTNPYVGDLRIYTNAESVNNNGYQYIQKRRKNGIYGNLNFDWDNKLFFSGGLRYEAASTLTKNVLYPSLSLGYILFNNQQSAGVNFFKLRASYGQIGIEPLPYLNKTTYDAYDRTSTWGETLAAANYGNPFAQSSISGNPNLKQETVTESEFGGDLRFLKDRVSLGLTYYSRETRDAILNIDLPASTGFSSIFKNAATISNKGIEADLSIQAIKKKDFSLDINANFSKNKNLVKSLSGVKYYALDGFTGTSSGVAEGKPFGVLWGGIWERDSSSNKLILNEDGFPKVAGEEGVLGDPNPKWRGGLGATLKYKGARLSFLFDTFQGGKIWTGTEGVLKYFGIHPETANEVTLTKDLKTYDGRTVKAGTTVRGNIHDFGGGDVLLDSEWYTSNGGGFGSVSEDFVVDGSWTKLRELTLGYDLPKGLVDRLKMQKISINLTGRNLFIWTPVKYIDPETNLTGVSKGRGLEYFTNPGTASYILTINLGF